MAEMGTVVFVGAVLIVALLYRRDQSELDREMTEKAWRLKFGLLLVLFVLALAGVVW